MAEIRFLLVLLGVLVLLGCPTTDDDDVGDDDVGDDDSAAGDDDSATVDYCADYDPTAPLPSDWVAIEGGTFEMGSEDGDYDEQPVHTVNVPSFDIWRTEVTVGQYAHCFCAGVCTAALIPEDESDVHQWRGNWEKPGRDHHPVNYVDWYAAVAFCGWLGGRLPSEAEWEYAARSGGMDNVYPWGANPPTCERTVKDSDDIAPGCDTGLTWEVCGKPAGNTEQGLCDMAGNVWEWVQDCYYYNYVGAPTDGSAWDSAADGAGVIRGGCFVNVESYNFSSTYRVSMAPEHISHAKGFRCLR